MNKKFVFFSILLSIGMLFMVSSVIDPKPQLMSSVRQGDGVHEISFSPQATAEPPIPIPTIVIPIPTIVINPTPSTGLGGLITPLTILVFILVGAIILIALVAVIRRPS